MLAGASAMPWCWASRGMAPPIAGAGVALANAAKHKLVGLLAQQLKPDNVYVGEVMIAGTIKGTGWAGENAIEPAVVGAKFWELFAARSEVYARLS